MSRRLAERLLACAVVTGPVMLPAPAIAQAPSLRELIEVVDLSGVSPSPDGTRVAFRVDRPSVERNSYDLDWFVVEVTTGRASHIAGGGDADVEEPGRLVTGAPAWSADSRSIIYRALRGGEIQLYRSGVDGTAAVRLTSEDGNVRRVEISDDGRSLRYWIGPSREAIVRAEQDEFDSGILVDQHVELGDVLHRGAIIDGRQASQRLTGQWFTRGGLLWSVPERPRRLDLSTLAITDDVASGAVIHDIDVDPGEEATRAGDGARVRTTGEGHRLVVEGLRDWGPVSCSAPNCPTERIRWLQWRPGHDQVVIATADRLQATTLHLWDVRSGRVRMIVAADGLLAGARSAGAPCAIVEAAAICVTASAVSPPRLERINIDTGRRQVLFDPNERLRSAWVPRAERLVWTDGEGHAFNGILFRPMASSGEPIPLFINYYSCEGYLRGGLGDEWPITSLAAQGIATLCVNATRRSGTQDSVAAYRAALGGIRVIVDRLAGEGLIDRRRVGMGGLSFGSEVTMWTAFNSDLLAAVSIASPQIEPSYFWFNGQPGRDNHDRVRQVWGLGAPEETPERWREIIPAYNVERIHAPVLMQMAEQEARNAVELYTRLRLSRTPAEMYVFPLERHIKVMPRHRLAVYQRNLDWFRFWLQGYEDPDPSRAAQYVRWRDMRSRRDAAVAAPDEPTVSIAP